MPRLSHPEIASLCRAVGLSDEQTIVACAISGWDGCPYPAESGGDPQAIGDVALANGKWGPSIGLWQVRSLNEQKGTGQERDGNALADPMFNARSMFTISKGGTSWQPWSVYTSGQYRKNMDASAEQLRAGGGGGTSWYSAIDWTPGFSLPGLPGGVPGADTIGALFSTLLSGTWWRRVLVGLAGVALMLVGVAFVGGDLLR